MNGLPHGVLTSSHSQRTGAEGLILDLRGNPGGLVRAGLDVARIFLNGPTTIFNVTGRSGGGFPTFAQV